MVMNVHNTVVEGEEEMMMMMMMKKEEEEEDVLGAQIKLPQTSIINHL